MIRTPRLRSKEEQMAKCDLCGKETEKPVTYTRGAKVREKL
jgi:hypothetical protein